MNTRMKWMMLVALTMMASAQANASVVLECSTQGDSLAAVQLEKNKNGETIKVIHMDESVDSYPLMSGLSNIKKGESDTLVGSKELDKAFGGAIPNAALMRVLPGQKKAFLSVGGTVYILNCFPQ